MPYGGQKNLSWSNLTETAWTTKSQLSVPTELKQSSSDTEPTYVSLTMLPHLTMHEKAWLGTNFWKDGTEWQKPVATQAGCWLLSGRDSVRGTFTLIVSPKRPTILKKISIMMGQMSLPLKMYLKVYQYGKKSTATSSTKPIMRNLIRAKNLVLSNLSRILTDRY